jgi:FkbM family methyltransferase
VSEAFNRLRACRHGQMLYNRHDLHIGRSLELYGEWAESELELLGLFVNPGDVVVDVGANVGTHTVFFARRVGPTGLVHAFEPQRIVFQTLCANLALNSLTNVHAHQSAVGRAEGSARVPPIDYRRAANFGGVALDGVTEGESVRVMPLDRLDLPRCKLVKMDVEGMELAALEGARSLIERCRPMIYLENNDARRSRALIEALAAHHYRLFWHFSRFYNPQNFAGNGDNVFGKLVDLNMIAVNEELAAAFESFPAVEGPHDTGEAALDRQRPSNQ